MNPVKIIVQGMPLRHDHCTYPDTCMNEDKRNLERLLAKYGPVRCTYLWSNEASHSALPHGDVADNFAHVFFKNYEDSMRACQAASNHELSFRDCILSLTPVSNSTVPIDILDDDALIKVFSKLDFKERLKIEEVCPHWEEISLHSWSNMKKLDLSFYTVTESEFETYLMKCGKYLEEIICKILSISSFEAIGTHCEKMKAIDLAIFIHSESVDQLPSALTRMLGRLRDLKSLKLTHDYNQRYDFLNYSAESIEKVRVIANCVLLLPPTTLDLTRFHNLQHFTLRGYKIEGLNGIESLKKLTHLDISLSEVPRCLLEEIAKLSKLKTLEIWGDDIDLDDDALIKIIRNVRELERLDIHDHPTLTDRSLQLISMLPNLKYLNISGLNHVNLMFMDGMSSLKELHCQRLDSITNEGMGRLISLAPNLKYLDVSESSITANFFTIANAAVKSRGNGVVLTIVTSQYVSDSGEEQLSPLLNIESSWENRNLNLQCDDLYDDVNDDDCDIYNEDLDDFGDYDGFELF